MSKQLTNTRLGPLSDEPGFIRNVLCEFIAARAIVGFSDRGDLAKEIYSTRQRDSCCKCKYW